MKNIQETHDEIDAWHKDGAVGNLTLFSAPRSHNFDIICEEVIKLREMDRETKAAVTKVFDLFQSEKVEMFLDKNGYPDRVKIVRRL